ncbi:MAG: hypothetical protein GEU91_22445 [Rhizobiales bacterium]|nr:hypothetical protein [Hyphomicrobiales bacterium]
MQTSSVKEHQSFFGAVMHWWRNWRSSRTRVAELSNFTHEEMQHIARDVGVTTTELRVLAGKWPESADLLTRRMAVLGLDAAEVAHSQPSVSKDLERLCSLCASKRRCESDLATNPEGQAWQQYCPNHTTLTILRDERAKFSKDNGEQ